MAGLSAAGFARSRFLASPIPATPARDRFNRFEGPDRSSFRSEWGPILDEPLPEAGVGAEVVMELLRDVVSREPELREPAALALYRWMASEGLQRLDEGAQAYPEYRKPAEALAQIRALSSPGIFLLLDFHPYLKDPLVVRLLRDIAEHRPPGDTTTLADPSIVDDLIQGRQ